MAPPPSVQHYKLVERHRCCPAALLSLSRRTPQDDESDEDGDDAAVLAKSATDQKRYKWTHYKHGTVVMLVDLANGEASDTTNADGIPLALSPAESHDPLVR